MRGVKEDRGDTKARESEIGRTGQTGKGRLWTPQKGARMRAVGHAALGSRSGGSQTQGSNGTKLTSTRYWWNYHFLSSRWKAICQ